MTLQDFDRRDVIRIISVLENMPVLLFANNKKCTALRKSDLNLPASSASFPCIIASKTAAQGR
jgi:hypothetical protein